MNLYTARQKQKISSAQQSQTEMPLMSLIVV